MDLYQKNPNTLRKLLAKRQNPCTQTLKNQSSDTSNPLKPKINPLKGIKATTLDFNYINEHLHCDKSSPNFTKLSSCHSGSSSTTQSSRKSTMNNPIEIIDLDSDSFETVEKKIKLTTSGKTSRRTSFDDEKAISEHSTTCDTHSEGHNNHEAGDFLWSPTINGQAQPSKDPVILILDDDDDVPSKSEDSFMFVAPNKDASIYAEAQSQAETLGGNCLTTTGSLSNGKLKFRCKLSHLWEASLEEMKQRWCPKCADMLKKCRAFAETKGGSCLAEKFDETISFICHAGHTWTASSRTYKTKWCTECIHEEKEEFKRKCQEARAKREKLEEEYQQKLFEEARRKAFNGFANHETFSKEDVLKYFQKVDLEVEGLAKKEADSFMSENGSCGNVNYQQALQVYKILLMPEDILMKYMMSLSPEILKSEFRRMAKIIHPDKNKHPRSGSAFQKVYKVYEIMINKSEGNQ